MAKKTHNYALSFCALIPIDTVEEGRLVEIGEDFPAGSIVTADVVEELDLSNDAEWSQWGEVCMMALARQIQKEGWPKKETSANEPPAEASDPGKPTPATIAANVGAEGNPGRCWNCNNNLIETARGVFCPEGCPDSPPDEEIEKNLNESKEVTAEELVETIDDETNGKAADDRMTAMERAIMDISKAVAVISVQQVSVPAETVDPPPPSPMEKPVTKPVRKAGAKKKR